MPSSCRELPRRILLICHDVVGENMAGPAIRYWEMARVLGKDFVVTLATPGRPTLKNQCFEIRGYARSDPSFLASLVAAADVVVAFGFVVHQFSFLQFIDKPLIVDVYDPFTLEHLEAYDDLPILEKTRMVSLDAGVLNRQFLAGDYFICANERQRRFWLGVLTANGRINPTTYDENKTLSRLIDVVPFGLPSAAPRHKRRVLKGVRQGIEPADKVILWGGGIWEWLDPITLVRAVAKIAQVRDDVKLFFLGKQHFDTVTAPETGICRRTFELCRELGLLNTKVFFNSWTPYYERENYLLEADVGVSLHPIHVETRFASRTRVLDYIWAGLPIVTNGGDSMSEIVQRRRLGKVVPGGDVDALVAALVELLDTPDLKERLRQGFEKTADEYTWERVTMPLANWCRAPQKAADKGRYVRNHLLPVAAPLRPTPVWKLPWRAMRLLRSDGAARLAHEVRTYVRWKMADYQTGP